MGIKEFFKLTIGKIILFLLIPAFYSQSSGIICDSFPCPQPYEFAPFITAIFSHITYDYQDNQVQNIILGIISSYIMACIIIFLYNKLNIKIKDFLKMNVPKIILAGLILILMFKIRFIELQNNPGLYESIFEFLISRINPYLLIELLILSSYLLSCTLIFIVNKLRKK